MQFITDSSIPNSSEDEFVVPEINSPDSINEDLFNPLTDYKSPKRLQTLQPTTESKRNPSPYYYSDLLKKKDKPPEQIQTESVVYSVPKPQALRQKEAGFKARKSSSLDTPGAEKEVCLPKRYSITEEGVRIIRCDSPSTTTSDDTDCSECQKRREWHANALAVVRAATSSSRTHDDSVEYENHSEFHSHMPPHRLLGPAICACTAPPFGDDADELFRPRSIFYVHQQGTHECVDCAATDSLKSLILNEEMSNIRQRKLYETAFDSKLAKSDDDLDEVDRITNHSAQLCDHEYKMVTSQSRESCISHKPEKKRKKKGSSSKDAADVKLLKELENLKIEENIENIVNANVTSIVTATIETTSQSPLRSAFFAPSPPSTAPLPMKFPSKQERFFINSIQSAPNLPASNAIQHPRLKNLRLDKQPENASDGSMLDSSYGSPKGKERPRSVIEGGRVFELKRSHLNNGDGRRNYSSTESMATSSSGGSMESLR